jgi:hypothetical protein
MFYTQVGRVRRRLRGDRGARVLDFTYTFYNSRDLFGFQVFPELRRELSGFIPFTPIQYRPLTFRP